MTARTIKERFHRDQLVHLDHHARDGGFDRIVLHVRAMAAENTESLLAHIARGERHPVLLTA